MTTDLRSALTETLESVQPTHGDLDRARRDGRRIRTRRRAAAGIGAAAVVAVAGAVAWGAVGSGPDRASDPTSPAGYPELGPLDLSGGLRAYADPGNEIHLGGRTFPAKNLEWLDTDAVATDYGVVFFDHGRPMLLDADGSVTPLAGGPSAPIDSDPEFHPTAKAGDGSLVAWATRSGDTATVTVHDLATGEDVASTDVTCGRCHDLVIDAVDSGVVFVRDQDGTRTWDSRTGGWAPFAGPKTRVADVRNGVVLYSGPAPADPGDWTLVAGAVDSQLSFDGRYVLGWSSRLEPVRDGDPPVVLDQGPTGDDPRREGSFGWWTFDTDGSVLVATGKDYGDFTVYDCVLPSGACTELGPLHPTGGDPQFIGNDM